MSGGVRGIDGGCGKETAESEEIFFCSDVSGLDKIKITKEVYSLRRK